MKPNIIQQGYITKEKSISVHLQCVFRRMRVFGACAVTSFGQFLTCTTPDFPVVQHQPSKC